MREFRYKPAEAEAEALMTAVLGSDLVKLCFVVTLNKKHMVVPKGIAVVMAKQQVVKPNETLVLAPASAIA